MTLLLGKDFKIELGYVPRKEFDGKEIEFVPVGEHTLYARTKKTNEKLIEEGWGEFLLTQNKPEHGEGLWVSPCNGDFNTWGETCVELGFDHYCDYYYIIKPTADCRILNIDSLDAYYDFETKYDFQWDLMSKDFDMLYVSSFDAMGNLGRMFMSEIDTRKPKYHLMMHGWDCESGVFLNDKFIIGEKVKYKVNFRLYV